MRRLILPAAVAVIAVTLVLAGWVIVSPGWAVGFLSQQVAQQLGRKLDVKGGAALEFTPRLAIRLDHASLSNPSDMDGSFITARAVRVPVRVSDLFTRNPDLSVIELEGAEIALLINERSETSWAFPAVKTPAPLSLELTGSSMRFFDARSSQAFSLAGARMTMNIGVEGDVTVKGTADMGGRLAKIDAALKSLSRIQEDGSPLDLSIEVPDGTASFTGRLSSTGVLNLAGPVTLSSPDLRAVARWAGLEIEQGGAATGIAVAGALESAGRAFAIRHADVRYGNTQAQGDIVLDLRNTLPKLQAILRSDRLPLDQFIPDGGAKPGTWGTRPIDLHILKAFDTDITVDANMVSTGETEMGPARVTAATDGGKFRSTLSVPAPGKGSLSLEAAIDASAVPPVFELSIRGKDVDAQAFLPAIVQVPWFTGHGDVNVALSGTGHTQLEIIGTLTGSILLSLADGEISGPDLGVMLGQVSQRIVEGWTDAKGAGRTTYKIIGAEAKVADGIATVSDARVETDGLSLSVNGSIDLLRRALGLSIVPKIIDASGSATSLPVPVIVKGPWDRPRLYPDLPDVLAKPKAAFESLKAMGLPAAN